MVKTQLLLIMEADFVAWKDWLGLAKLDDYSVIDILFFGDNESMMPFYSKFLTKPNYFLHQCLSPLAEQLNYLIRDDCDYYVVNTNPGTLPVDLPGVLSQWISAGNHIIMARATEGYNNLVVYTYMSKMLDHFGAQSVQTKIQIHAANYQREDLVYGSISEFISAATAANS